ncbi:hypothetical protein ACWCQ0_00430 [Streptomyces massasporeus]|uniref:hypothetical protein n=1 Tax=Streptomyces massasporeus TaxID=67324 RepID=UPI0033DBA140
MCAFLHPLHTSVQHLFVDLQVVDQAQAGGDAVAHQLAGDLAVLDLEEQVRGPLMWAPPAGSCQVPTAAIPVAVRSVKATVRALSRGSVRLSSSRSTGTWSA